MRFNSFTLTVEIICDQMHHIRELNKGKDKHTISSVDIYNGVLKNNLHTLSEIEANLG